MIPLWEKGKFGISGPDTDPNLVGSFGLARYMWRYVVTLGGRVGKTKAAPRRVGLLPSDSVERRKEGGHAVSHSIGRWFLSGWFPLAFTLANSITHSALSCRGPKAKTVLRPRVALTLTFYRMTNIRLTPHTALEGDPGLIWVPSRNSNRIRKYDVWASIKYIYEKNLPRVLHYWHYDFRLFLL